MLKNSSKPLPSVTAQSGRYTFNGRHTLTTSGRAVTKGSGLRRLFHLALALLAAGIAFAELGGAFLASPDHPAIEYATRPVYDTVAQLNRKIQAGTVHLGFESPKGYLLPVLEALEIPIESQLSVFSKTSLQMHLINPNNPRTIFFNDAVAVAWVPGEPFLEIASQDPQQGIVFYGLNQWAVLTPQFTRRDDCLVCHESYATLGVPGMLLRSVFTAPDGTQMRQLGEHISDHRSPLEERWGGWFVTGNLGNARHMGNGVGVNPAPSSDVAALMVFGHQMHMMNLLTRVGWEARFAMYEEPTGGELTARLLKDGAKELVDYMLFVDEAQLPGKIQGSSAFTQKFAERGPRDSRGRSLRELDLERRLFRYPCSYMIYAQAFDALPGRAKEAIYKRMWQVLSGEEKGEKYPRLSGDDRRAILEILRETKPGLPDYFQGRL